LEEAINWNEIAAWGQWANAIGQIVTASALLVIAHRTFAAERKQNKMTMITERLHFVNQWNALILASGENVEAFNGFGRTILGVREVS
jgi:hypothetical protein